MKMSFRWYGQEDPVRLWQIRQIPGMVGVVSALYTVPVGEVWPVEHITALKREIAEQGLELTVIESVPVHEDIKLGRPTRDRYIENFIETVRRLGQAGIRTVCYNFMPVFDWTRSRLDYRLPDGSLTLAYDEEEVARMNPLGGEWKLPGWDASYGDDELEGLMRAYREVDAEALWSNLAYFIRAVAPAAQEAGVKLAVHPDDPPWSVFGLPRILCDGPGLRRVLDLCDVASNGLCVCTGSLGASPDNDVPSLLREFLARGRVHFVHARNVRVTGPRRFHESGHQSADGSVDMYEVMTALAEFHYDGPIRPDHGRMIWGEQGRPGYGLYDRALGAAYLNGLWEAVRRQRTGA
ncbi:mannonate dehydratase [Alicyclobacillus shizuokensis]|uniref:mannonate dehydratase n=1 Tax=Alicyclobacillus shizuokensis TaxID=392014 RepID=UPI00082BD71F|nr:mannonate dehydratase [Alicyclobacillus shizuokensis]MCL6626109.1 mannonate dehydratase [Alicyclobacillus shizuokensis]